ncbi:hypothetical protein [Halorientalis salina]|uniref:hypothetical protein n=1 Tax=Halorientalis salina TaxID=2932266 RepID=UPI0010AC69B6|nr:hypothetical protein [Halorientalis salina]
MTDAMNAVSHTNPYTDEPFGETVTFRRGQTVVADGGERTGTDEQTMKDVSHTPPAGDGAMRVFERGTEGRDESV